MKSVEATGADPAALSAGGLYQGKVGFCAKSNGSVCRAKVASYNTEYYANLAFVPFNVRLYSVFHITACLYCL